MVRIDGLGVATDQGDPVDVGMTLPVMEPDLWADGAGTLERWTRAIDDGPFASVCFGERMAFDNPETLTLLGAVSAWTSRVRITTTVIVPQLHDPVLLAKSLATADQLWRRPLDVGVRGGWPGRGLPGRGRRPLDPDDARDGDSVARMKRVWAGEQVTDAVRPVEHLRPCRPVVRAARGHHGPENHPQCS